MYVVKAFFSSLSDSLEIIGQALYVGINKKYGKIKLTVVALMVIGLLVFAVNASNIFVNIISDGRSDSSIFESIFVVASQQPKVMVTVYIWTLLIAALFTPVVSNSILSIYNKSSMISVKKNDMHVVTDSILLQFASIITLMQMVAFIAIGGILKFAAGFDNYVFLALGSIWMFFASFTCFMAWFMEFLLRKYGAKVKGIYIAVQGVALLVLNLFIPELNTKFLGIDSLLFDSLKNPYTSILFIVGFLFLSFLMSLATFRLGLYVNNYTTAYTVVKKTASQTLVSLPRLTGRILWRNGNVKVPILMMVVIASGATFIFGAVNAGLVGFVIAIPMVVSMAACVNIFGIIGSGNAWAFTLPNFASNSLKFFFFYNLGAVFLANLLVILPSMIAGKANLYTFAMFMLSTLVSGSIMSVLALYYAYKTPNRYDAHIRGENILPPSKSLKVLIFMVSVGGAPAAILFTSSNILFAVPAALSAIFICFMIVKSYAGKVSEKFVVNDIISLTS